MQQVTAGHLKEPHRKSSAVKAAHGSRTRPTNNQLLYRATFQWEHYLQSLYGNPKLPNATEACASVTSAFLQVVGVLFEVERLREDQPRNILRLLSTNTRRTKVVELSSGTHRVPDELKRHSIGDGEGGQYSTNLDRNRYGSDDQYLATVIRYNLEFLDLCPCLVDVTILDAKGGDIAVVVSAGSHACLCHAGAPRQPHQEGKQRTIRTVGGRSLDLEEQQQLREGVLPREKSPHSPAADHSEPSKPAEWRHEAAAPSKSNGGSELFDALLMAAAEPPVTSRQKPRILPKSPRFEAESSGGDSDEIKEDDTPKAASEEPLRRSSRKSVKLFNAAALEREGSADSEDDLSAQSMEGDTELTPQNDKAGREEWDGGFHPLKRRRGVPQRGASAANLSKLASSSQGQETRKLHQEVRRLQEELQVMLALLEESREQEMEARQQLRKLQQEIACKGGQKRFSNQVGYTSGEEAGNEGSMANVQQPYSQTQELLTSSLLREAHDLIANLQKEKLMLCNTLTAAGVPLPLPPSEIPTPHRNGESPLNGFAGLPHIGTPGSSAFSVPLALQPFPGLQQFQRALTSIAAPAAVNPQLAHITTEDSPRVGGVQGVSPRLLRPVVVQQSDSAVPGTDCDKRSPAAPESSKTPPPKASGFSAKRRLTDDVRNEYKAPCNGERVRNGELQHHFTARSR